MMMRLLAFALHAQAALPASLAARAMSPSCTIQDGHGWLATPARTVELAPVVRLARA